MLWVHEASVFGLFEAPDAAGLSFDDAAAFCRDSGMGELASVRDAAEWALASGALASSQHDVNASGRAWIGMQDGQWLDGAAYDDFNGVYSAGCVFVGFDGQWTWDEVPCATLHRFFLCRQPLEESDVPGLAQGIEDMIGRQLAECISDDHCSWDTQEAT